MSDDLTTEKKISLLKERLEKEVAQHECWIDSRDFNPCDFSGGNYDDAYYGGSADGRASLARELLKEFFE
jgi:hypothetical protein